jgi:hypothetical protein
MKYPTTYLKEILDLIAGVISGGKVSVDTELTGDFATAAKQDTAQARLDLLATQATLAAASAKLPAALGAQPVAGSLSSVPSSRTFTGTPVLVNLSGTTARSAQLAVGLYFVRALTACYVLQGAVTVDATTAKHVVGSGEVWLMAVTDATANGYLAGITDGASVTGGLRIEPVI